ncbi:MAG: ECF transporter S component [Lachnospiraceae bacterium]|nr:ECF transporter S component [Lachnospiraceae bacterium]
MKNEHTSAPAGLDGRVRLAAALPVAFALIVLFAPWLSMPELRYTRYGMTFTLRELPQLLEGIGYLAESGTQFDMTVFTASRAGLLAGIRFLQALAVAGGILCLIFAVLALRLRARAAGLGRVVCLWGLCVSVGTAIWNLWLNRVVNRGLGTENTFASLSVDSHIQVTAWVCALALLSLLLLPFVRRLLDTGQDPAAERFITRAQKPDERMGRRTLTAIFLIVLVIPALIFFGIWFLNDRSYYFIALCIILVSMLPFFLVFEDRRPQARELLILAVLSAMAVAGRAAFFMLPQFKPVTAIVIIAGISFGAEAGFLVGAVSGFVSNFFFGQGPWTPWQMFAWGIIGFLAGLIFRGTRRKWRENRTLLCAFGGLATVLIYGLIMDTASLFMYSSSYSWEALAALYVSGFPFNVIHGVSTVVFLRILGRPMFRKLDRIKRKYGILEP